MKINNVINNRNKLTNIVIFANVQQLFLKYFDAYIWYIFNYKLTAIPHSWPVPVCLLTDTVGNSWVGSLKVVGNVGVVRCTVSCSL